VVFVAQWRAEERHDPIAHHLVHRPLEAMDGIHHVLEHRIEDLPRLFGVAVSQQFHRAPEIGEEYRDLLAFALQRTSRGENPFGEVSGRIGLRGDAWRGAGGVWGHLGLPAVPAELRAGSVWRTTGGTHGFHACPALVAEHGVDGTVATALRTLHRR
jgi:hypothetical protein